MVFLPARQANAAGCDVEQHNCLVGKVEFPFQHIIIKTKELVENLLGHVGYFNVEPCADTNLVEDINQIIGFTDSRRR